jgi:cytochrome c-type biogenesis protein CcmE
VLNVAGKTVILPDPFRNSPIVVLNGTVTTTPLEDTELLEVTKHSSFELETQSNPNIIEASLAVGNPPIN